MSPLIDQMKSKSASARPDPAAFDASEYANRLSRTRARMTAAGCRLLVVDSVEDIYYLTGVSVAGTSYQAYLVPDDGVPVMVMRSLDASLFRGDQLKLGDCIPFGDSEDGVDCTIAATRKLIGRGIRLGLDLASQALTVSRYRKFEASFDAIIDCSDLVRTIRLVKSPAEIDHMRRAAGIVDATMSAIARDARPDMSVRDIVSLAAASFMELGAGCAHVGPISAGKRSGLHATLDSHILEVGDVIHAELLPEFRGYSARLMRSVVLGDPTDAQLSAIEMLVAAQDAQFEMMRPGAPARNVDAAGRRIVDESGLRPGFDGVTGYTLGLYGMPRMSRISDFARIFTRSADWYLEEGMTFHMYLSAGGVAISETVLITATGIECLTRTPRRILLAGARVGAHDG